MTVMRERACTKIPYTTKNGKYDDNSTLAAEKSMGIGWWTNGFWAGMMWLLYHETKEERYAEIARFSEEQLDTCLMNFMISTMIWVLFTSPPPLLITA